KPLLQSLIFTHLLYNDSLIESFCQAILTPTAFNLGERTEYHAFPGLGLFPEFFLNFPLFFDLFLFFPSFDLLAYFLSILSKSLFKEVFCSLTAKVFS